MVSSAILYTIFIALTGIERLIEVRVSNRNAAWSFEQGGIERGKGHYPFMVVLHTGFLFGAVAEVWLLNPEFSSVFGWVWFAIALLCQGLRWWCINTLGNRWKPVLFWYPTCPESNLDPTSICHIPTMSSSLLRVWHCHSFTTLIGPLSHSPS